MTRPNRLAQLTFEVYRLRLLEIEDMLDARGQQDGVQLECRKEGTDISTSRMECKKALHQDSSLGCPGRTASGYRGAC